MAARSAPGSYKSVNIMYFVLAMLIPISATAAQYAGLTGKIGADASAKRVKELRITESGVYENILVDGGGASMIWSHPGG